MPPTAEATWPTPTPPTSDEGPVRYSQRETLGEIVKLSIHCSESEQRIEEQHAQGIARETEAFEKQVQAAEKRAKDRLAAIAKESADAEAGIQARYESRRQEIEAAREEGQAQAARQRREVESTLKKDFEQASWQAESTFVQVRMKVDTDEQNWKKVEEQSAADLASLDAIEGVANRAVARCGIAPGTVEPQLEKPLAERVASDRLGVLEEYRNRSKEVASQLNSMTMPRITDAVVPWFVILVLAAGAGAAGWNFGSNDHARMMAAAGGAAAVVLIGAVLWMLLRARSRRRVQVRARDVYETFKQVLGIAREAARVDSLAAAAAREKRVKTAQRERDVLVQAAKERARSIQNWAAEQYQGTMAEVTGLRGEQTAQNESERDRALEQVRTQRDATTTHIQAEESAVRQEAEARRDRAMQEIEATYDRELRELGALWEDGLQRVKMLLAAGSGIDPQLIDWNSPAWNGWSSPKEFSGHVRFGEMTVDLSQLTERLPKRLKLPEAFRVPAQLSLPEQGSLFIEGDQTGRAACGDLAKLVMARLLTQVPAGRVKFTIFDPAALGQNFAGFMHLTDHDESLVGARIWTEKEHLQQRLTDLTEHMETVIQKYLRNEYTTIDEYNAQAGELAEPYRFLVLADFPTGFEPETLRRLSSIAMTGPRCGVYTIILRDTRMPLPQGSRIEDILARSVHLQYKNGTFVWQDAVFKQFPLRVDAPPEEGTLTALMDRVGVAAKEAKRVEVPFGSIAPGAERFWSLSSKEDLRVPIGKAGATRLQHLRLGVGVAQHVLVAGKTGSGKSNLMHTIVTNMAMWYGPEEVEFYLVDFKKGVEFKAYASRQLPHARAIAVESDREFGLSVLQRVDAELTRRGAMFRDVGAQEIRAFREKTGQKLPRTVLLIDEFQEFFSEDDKVGQEASGLLDRLVRQGRAFGVHVILGSQTIGGSSGLARSTLGQIAVRIALQCSEADSQMILGDSNNAARLLSRPGEAVYNDAGGLVEANSPFQIAFLPDEERDVCLENIHERFATSNLSAAAPIVFEGNAPASIGKNQRLTKMLKERSVVPVGAAVRADVGEPVAIKEPSAILFRRQIGANVLMVGQQEESAAAILASMVVSLAAQHGAGDARFYLLDGTAADSRLYGVLEKVLAAVPQEFRAIALRQVPEAIDEISKIVAAREGEDGAAGPAVYVLIFGLQRFRVLRRQEDDFSFSRSEEPAQPKTDKQFASLLAEGPGVGVHTCVWADTPITIERTLERGSMRQFDHRILFQMSAADSSNLIDSPLANHLGAHRALLYSEEQGTVEKFRPYEVPDAQWLAFVQERLRD